MRHYLGHSFPIPHTHTHTHTDRQSCMMWMVTVYVNETLPGLGQSFPIPHTHTHTQTDKAACKIWIITLYVNETLPGMGQSFPIPHTHTHTHTDKAAWCEWLPCTWMRHYLVWDRVSQYHTDRQSCMMWLITVYLFCPHHLPIEPHVNRLPCTLITCMWMTHTHTHTHTETDKAAWCDWLPCTLITCTWVRHYLGQSFQIPHTHTHNLHDVTDYRVR